MGNEKSRHGSGDGSENHQKVKVLMAPKQYKQKLIITDRCCWQMTYHRKKKRLSSLAKSQCPNQAAVTINGTRYCSIHASYVTPQESASE